jgi:hypothetical protein
MVAALAPQGGFFDETETSVLFAIGAVPYTILCIASRLAAPRFWRPWAILFSLPWVVTIPAVPFYLYLIALNPPRFGPVAAMPFVQAFVLYCAWLAKAPRAKSRVADRL